MLKRIRQYLHDKVLPAVTEGIIEIFKENPEDPTNYMINFLRSYVDKMKNEKNSQVAESSEEDDSF